MKNHRKSINSTKNYQIICKIFMIKSKITKLAKVEKTEKLPPVSPPASQKRTSEFPDFPLKSARLNANLLGAQITSRSNAHGRDRHAGQLGAETTSETASEITSKVQGSTSKSHLNVVLLRFQIISHSNVQGSVLSVQASVLKVWNYFTFKCAILLLNRVRMQICSESDLLCIQTRWDSPLNAILPRSQITSHSNVL